MYRNRAIFAAVAVIGLTASVLALAAPAGASVLGSPVTIPTYPAGNASYDTDNTATSASATVLVPWISCASNPAGTVAGQAAEVQLYGSAVGTNGTLQRETADVRAYCDGKTAAYATEFVVNDWSAATPAQVFIPAQVRVWPGNLLQLTATATANGATVSIRNLNTGQHASASGPGFVADEGPLIGISAPTGNGSGGLLTSGSVPYSSSAPAIAGPVPSTPILFSNVTVDWTPLSRVAGLYSTYWTTNGESTGQTVGSVSGIFGLDSFLAKVTP